MRPLIHHRAIALPLVLWGIAFMGALVVMVAVRMNERIEEESRAERAFRARQLALSGIAFGLHPDIEPGSPLLRSGNDDEGFRVEIRNEAGRINPNTWAQGGNRELFRSLFGSWDVPLDRADSAIDSLIDWIDPDTLRQLAGAEAPEYSAAGMDGLPANGPLTSVSEMASILNLRDVLAEHEGWIDLFTVWHSGKINIVHADRDVLAGVGGLSDFEIENLITYRQGTDGIEGTEDDGAMESLEEALAIAGISGGRAAALDAFFSVGGDIRRVESTGVCNGVEHKITAIVGDGGEPLAWEER
jgi:type II secretory pathway component PulK